MGIAFCRAVIDMKVASGLVLMVAHPHPLRTKGNAVGVKFHALFIEEMRIGFLAVLSEGNHGTDVFFAEIAVVGLGIMVAVAAEDGNVKVKLVFAGGLEKTVEGVKGEGEVALVAAWHERQQGQVVAILMEHQVVVAIAKNIAFAVGIVAPFGGGGGVAPLMITLVDAVGATVAGGFAAG